MSINVLIIEYSRIDNKQETIDDWELTLATIFEPIYTAIPT